MVRRSGEPELMVEVAVALVTARKWYPSRPAGHGDRSKLESTAAIAPLVPGSVCHDRRKYRVAAAWRLVPLPHEIFLQPPHCTQPEIIAEHR